VLGRALEVVLSNATAYIQAESSSHDAEEERCDEGEAGADGPPKPATDSQAKEREQLAHARMVEPNGQVQGRGASPNRKCAGWPAPRPLQPVLGTA